jgi:membrane protease YdiL (CAAX protease family)
MFVHSSSNFLAYFFSLFIDEGGNMSTTSNIQPTNNLETNPRMSLRTNPAVDLILLAFRPQLLSANSATADWIKRHPLLALFSLAYGLTWLGALPTLIDPTLDWQHNINLPDLLIAIFFIGGCLWAAAIVATASGGMAGRSALFRKLLRWRVNPVWYLVALLFPAAIYLAGQALNTLFGGAQAQFPLMAIPPSTWLMVVITSIGGYMIGNSEEFAWRGIALPRLQAKYSALNTALILGVVQAVWHLPYFFVPNSIEQQLSPLGFLVWNLALNIVITWIFNNAKGSLLIAVLFHAANDGWISLLATPNDSRPLFLSIGVLCVTAVVLVVIFGSKHLSRKPEAEIAPAIETD